MAKTIPVELGDDPGRVALQCDGEIHGFLIARRFLRVRCRSRECRKAGRPVYRTFDLRPLVGDPVGQEEEECPTQKSPEA